MYEKKNLSAVNYVMKIILKTILLEKYVVFNKEKKSIVSTICNFFKVSPSPQIYVYIYLGYHCIGDIY